MIPIKKTLKEITDFVRGKVEGNPSIVITGAAGIKEARKGDITFLANKKYLPFLAQSQASALIISNDDQIENIPAIRVSNPYLAFARTLSFLYQKPTIFSGIHPKANVDPSASLDSDISIHPFATIGKNVIIKNHVQVYSGVSIGDNCFIGKGTVLFPNVTIYSDCRIGKRVIIQSGAVIGSDGFGYVWDGKEHYKIPQIGRVIIEDNVEIGACTCIDRGTTGNTIIKGGTKIDNSVQIAHNVSIGEHCIIVSQAGIAGSSAIGNAVILGGQVGVAGHLTIGDRTMVAAKSGITKDTPPDSIMAGTMAFPMKEWKKSIAYFRKFPKIVEEIKELKEKLNYLEKK